MKPFLNLISLGQRWLVPRLSVALLSVVFVLGLSLPAYAIGVEELPAMPPESHVLDTAEVLSRFTEGKLTGQFDALATNQGQEAYVVTFRGLDYEVTVEDFATALFTRWFPSQEQQANKILLVIDKATDNTAIRTGTAVKATLPDAIAESVAHETILVPLKLGNRYNQAFMDAGDRLMAVLTGQSDPGAPVIPDTVNVERNFATPEETQAGNGTLWVIVLLVVSTVVPMATYYFYVYLGTR
jgi:uncharacterized protein